jgi:hypothetical protein
MGTERLGRSEERGLKSESSEPARAAGDKDVRSAAARADSAEKVLTAITAMSSSVAVTEAADSALRRECTP